MYPSSIRQKIILGYYIGIAGIFGLSIFAFLTLGVMEKKIMFWEVTSELFDTTLEMRRFEKNFFLYRQDADFGENIRYVKRARDILEGNIEKYRNLEVYERLSALKSDLGRYEELMEKFSAAGKDDTESKHLEQAVREKGKQIVTAAEDVSKIEWKKLQLYLNMTRRNLIIAISVLSLGGIAFGQILSRIVVGPLKSLEERMKLIAEGRLEKVSINSKDREIVSLTNAFNKMLKELDMRQKHLVQREKLASLGTLLSGVAHELNNPLSNISSSCQILLEEFDKDDVEHKKELLSQIDNQTERARNIVRSLLEFSREEIFKKEILPLKNLIEDTIVFIRGDIPAGVEIIVDVNADIFIFAGKQRMQQMLLNLIKNAMESVAGEGNVYIRARKHLLSEETICERYRGKCTGECPVDKDTVDIEIEDTGSGIPPDVLPNIFDPFFTTKDMGRGSGLGLYIVQEIVEEHGGCIGVDSEPGAGSCFLIRLPLEE
jgi:two-component system, NtrC family, sensor kinase